MNATASHHELTAGSRALTRAGFRRAARASIESLESRLLLSAGDPDLTFGGSGTVLLPQPSAAIECRVRATAAQPDGKVLVAGSIGSPSNSGQGKFFLECLNVDGSVDTTFGAGGSVQTAIGPNSFATSILLQPDGRIIVGGATDDSASSPTNASFALARYNPDGSLDASFGSGGIVITDFPGNEEVDSLAFMPGGGIAAAGSYFLYPNVGFDVACYGNNGTLDTNFNQTGKLQYDLGAPGSNALTTAVAVQPNNDVLIGSHQNDQFAVYRFAADGEPDSTFGTNGVASTAGALGGSTSRAVNPDGSVAGAATKLLIQPDGAIVAAGPTPRNGVYAMARFTAAGARDTTFGTGGVVIVQGNTPPPSTSPYPLAGLMLQSDGSLLIAGSQGMGGTSQNQAQLLLRRFFSSGAADTRFHNSSTTGGIPIAAALDPAGKIAVAGDVATTGGTHQIGVARYQGDGGYVVTSLADGNTPGTLRYELAQANASEQSNGPVVITFAPNLSGTIKLTQGLIELTNTLTGVVIAGPGGAALQVSGNGSSSILRVDPAVSASISDLSFTAASSTYGAIQNSGRVLLLRCDVIHNTGPGIYNDIEGDLTLIGSTVASNTAEGIVNHEFLTVSSTNINSNGMWGVRSTVGASLDFSDVTLSYNAGGGLFNDEGRGSTLTRCTIVDNAGTGLDLGDTTTVTDCTISRNRLIGMIDYNAVVNVTGSTISLNRSGSSPPSGAGGILNTASAFLTLINCTIAANTTSGNGGGIYNDQSSLTAVNCTIANNTAASGGGIYNLYPSGSYRVTINNSIIASNHNTSGAADDVSIAYPALNDITGAYDLIGAGGSGGLTNGVNGNKVGIVNAGLAPLGNYGGPTQTIALMPGSPALDSGSNVLAVDANGKPLTTDQRGLSRIFGKAVDIGAFEAQPPALSGDVNHNGTVNLADLLILTRHFGKTTPLYENGDLDGNGAVGLFDFLTLARNFGSAGSAPAPTFSPVAASIPESMGDPTRLRRRIV